MTTGSEIESWMRRRARKLADVAEIDRFVAVAGFVCRKWYGRVAGTRWIRMSLLSPMEESRSAEECRRPSIKTRASSAVRCSAESGCQAVVSDGWRRGVDG